MSISISLPLLFFLLGIAFVLGLLSPLFFVVYFVYSTEV